MENEEMNATLEPVGTVEDGIYKVSPDEITDPRGLARAAIRVLDSRKAKQIRLIRVEEKTIIADYFVICSGNSNTQIRALANEVEFRLGEAGLVPLHTEGIAEATWAVLDYGSVIIHVFNRETRDFYNLEKLWNEAEEIDVSEILKD